MCFTSKIPFGKCIEIPGNLNTKDMPSFEFRQAKPNREIKFVDRLAYWCWCLMGWGEKRDYDVLVWGGVIYFNEFFTIPVCVYIYLEDSFSQAN